MLERIFHISRPVLWINTIGTTVVGMWLSGSLWSWEVLPVLLWMTLPANLLIYGINDVFDQETDAENPRKGSVEGARISASEVRPILFAVLITNVPFALYFLFFLPLSAMLWISLYILVFVEYSAPPARFKARPYFDSLSNAAYAFPLVFVPLALGASPVWAAALGLMAWSAAKHTFDAVQDIDEDREAGIETTAVRLGARGVVYWSGALWLVSVALFALVSIPVAVVVAGISAALVLALRRSPNPGAGRRLYRYSIAFPYVAGTFAGMLLVAALTFGAYP